MLLSVSARSHRSSHRTPCSQCLHLKPLGWAGCSAGSLRSQRRSPGPGQHDNVDCSVITEIYHTVNRLRSFQSSCHPVIQSFNHSVIWSLSKSLGHSVTWSLGHSVTWSLGHLVTWSLGHLSYCHICLEFNMLTNGRTDGWTTLGSTGLLRRQ